jgi:AAA domain
MSGLPARPLPKQGDKRKRDDDPLAPSKKNPAVDAKVKKTKEYFQSFLDAYEGKTTNALGRDHPAVNGGKNMVDTFKPTKCVIIASTDKQSQIIPYNDAEGQIKFCYDSFSQNPSLDIRIGAHTMSDGNFKIFHTLHINSEQMSAPVSRVNVKEIDTAKFVAAVKDMGLPALLNPDQQITDIVESVKNKFTGNAIDFIQFKVHKTLAIRHEKGISMDQVNAAKVLRSQLKDIEHITVVRGAISDNMRFVDDFWDFLVAKCMKEGIYWGFRLDRQVPSIDGKNIPYPEQVILGKQAAPVLSWLRDTEGNYISLPKKTWFTSIKEFQSLFTVALLQDTEYQRVSVDQFFSFDASSPQHEVYVETDKAGNSEHFVLHVMAGRKAGEQMPAVAPDTRFKIKVCDSSLPELEARVLDVPEGSEADFLLDIQLRGGNPWGSNLAHGLKHSTKLEMELNVTAPLRQLRALQEFVINGSRRDQDLVLGLVSTETTEDSFLATELKKLYEANKSLYNEHVNWQENLHINQLQEKAILSCINGPLANNFGQGPPGTGKSVVAVVTGLWAVMLGSDVLIASPTRTAGKANAAKFAKDIKKIPAPFQHKVAVVYFPTWSESMDRIYEATGFKDMHVTVPQDAAFEDLQLWRHVLTYAEELLGQPATKEDERAKIFLEVYGRLNAKEGHLLSDATFKEFKKFFMELANDFLHRKDKNLVVISTCNNSACLQEMKLTFPLIIIDEAAVAVETDTIVPAAIPHSSLLLLGDHLQSLPVVVSKKSNQAIQNYEMSFFERILENTLYDRTLLKISYRFRKVIADPVGMFGGYLGLASQAQESSVFSKDFAAFMMRDDTQFKLRPAPADAVCRSLLSRSYDRVAINVWNGHSSFPRSGGTSSVNFANINAGIAFLKAFAASNPRIDTADLMVVCPFTSQAELWKEQLKIQWPGSKVIVVTVGTSQGNEAKLCLFDVTVANTSDGAFLGFLQIWNRINVPISRPTDVLAIMLNLDLMRDKIQSLYAQNPMWAYFLLDLVDHGIICNYHANKNLPVSVTEFNAGEAAWSNEQTAAPVKKLPSHVAKPGQGPTAYSMSGGSTDSYSPLEWEYVQELRKLRDTCNANVNEILKDEKKWQQERNQKKQSALDSVADLNSTLPLIATGDDMEIDWEKS